MMGILKRRALFSEASLIFSARTNHEAESTAYRASA